MVTVEPKYCIVSMNTYTQQYVEYIQYGDSRTGIAVLQLKILTVQYLLYEIKYLINAHKRSVDSVLMPYI
jgi:hypothetical protein